MPYSHHHFLTHSADPVPTSKIGKNKSCSSRKSMAWLPWKFHLFSACKWISFKLDVLSRVVHCLGTGPMVLNIWFSTIRSTQETIKITLDNMHPIKNHTSEQCLFFPFSASFGAYFYKYVIFTDHTCNNCLNKCLWEYMTINTAAPGTIQVIYMQMWTYVSTVDRGVRNWNSALW